MSTFHRVETTVTHTLSLQMPGGDKPGHHPFRDPRPPAPPPQPDAPPDRPQPPPPMPPDDWPGLPDEMPADDNPGKPGDRRDEFSARPM
jgi:hypothetical protein